MGKSRFSLLVGPTGGGDGAPPARYGVQKSAPGGDFCTPVPHIGGSDRGYRLSHIGGGVGGGVVGV